MDDAKIMNVNSLSQIDKDRLRNAIREMNDSMTRAAAESDLLKDILSKICDDLGVDKKIVRRMAKVYFKANFNAEVEDNRTFEDFYSVVITPATNGA
jgi:Transcriptional regulator DsbA